MNYIRSLATISAVIWYLAALLSAQFTITSPAIAASVIRLRGSNLAYHTAFKHFAAFFVSVSAIHIKIRQYYVILSIIFT
jgi:hypothetical protein